MTDRNHLTVLVYNHDRHMIVHMTGLYTRLVTYARLHILTLVVSFYHDISYIPFIVLFLIFIILSSFISVYHIIITYVVIMHEQFLLHTLIRSLLTTLNSHVQDFWTSSYVVQVFVWSYASWGAGASLFLILVFLPFSCYYSLFSVYRT